MSKQLIDFLSKLNTELGGRLIDVDINAYVHRITQNATIIKIEQIGELNAFIAFYENDLSLDLAFLTMIAVATDFKNMGFGKLLLETSINRIEKKGFKRYGLCVRKDNISALKLYNNYGFKFIEEKEDDFIYLEKKIN